MTLIAVNKCSKADSMPSALQQAMAITEAIRDRAFELFEKRNGSIGSDLSDWLQAERELLLTPTAELVDRGKEYQASIALPGFDANEIQVTATPDALMVQTSSLYRRIEIPAAINVDKVIASADRGILNLIAPKAAVKRKTAAA